MTEESSFQLPYGAVYFRKSNPPREDWERDYHTASEDGMNIFRHWFMWGSIEVAPGVFDWEDYDRQLDLAAKHGMKTIIAEMITSVPEWVFTKHNHLLYAQADGTKVHSHMGGSSATGGFSEGSAGALCLDSAEARELAGRFLKELVVRYRDHEAMLGYDIWNECNYSPHVCYCSHTQDAFRIWLKKKYGQLKKLNQVWHRYSYADWNDVQIPTQLGPYPECMDWLQFKKENFLEQMQWRVDLIRSLDQKNKITAHGIAASLNNMAAGGSDDWLAASKVETYGLTWVATRKGSEPWKQWQALDLARAGSRGKSFWHAEMQGGPLWLQPQVIGRPKEDGRITKPEDIRIWNMISLAGGARGLLFPRWRPLLDGPLFGSFGPYELDGSRNSRSQMASSIAKWANDKSQKSLLESVPVQGDIGIVVVPETQLFNHLLSQAGEGQFYTKAMWGAYRGFFDHNIQADWVLIDHIEEYDLLYLPYPIKLSTESAQKLTKWVKNGGKLISEGCPAYFGDNGTVGTVQPNLGLDKVFGVAQEEVEFMPDISDDMTFDMNGKVVQCGLYLQSYKTLEGKLMGTFSDGRRAVVENEYGSGKTLLIGTFPSEAYFRTNNEGNKEFFFDIFQWASKHQKVKVANPHIQARLHTGEGGKYMWILNPTAQEIQTDVEITKEMGNVSIAKTLWGTYEGQMLDNKAKMKVPSKDAVILKIV